MNAIVPLTLPTGKHPMSSFGNTWIPFRPVPCCCQRTEKAGMGFMQLPEDGPFFPATLAGRE